MSAVNWTGADALDIRSAAYQGAPLVRATQYGGSMNFQFDMTPDGARAMAAELIAMADEAESKCANGVSA
jgi:hypothetical protein